MDEVRELPFPNAHRRRAGGFGGVTALKGEIVDVVGEPLDEQPPKADKKDPNMHVERPRNVRSEGCLLLN